MNEWLNINELSERTQIPDSTIRRYISKFDPYFISKGGARSRRYEDSAIKVLLRIKQLYDSGYESDEVDNILRKDFPVVIDGDNEQEQTENTVTPTLATVEDVAEIMDRLRKQEEFNKLLLEKLDSQERYIKESLEQRDKLLLESIRDMQEIRQQESKAMLETASTQEEEKKGFFQRLFKK